MIAMIGRVLAFYDEALGYLGESFENMRYTTEREWDAPQTPCSRATSPATRGLVAEFNTVAPPSLSATEASIRQQERLPDS